MVLLEHKEAPEPLVLKELKELKEPGDHIMLE